MGTVVFGDTGGTVELVDITGNLLGNVGSDSYAASVAAGYTGTEAQFYEQLAETATANTWPINQLPPLP